MRLHNFQAELPTIHDTFDPTAYLSTVRKGQENGMWTAMSMLITSAATAHCYSAMETLKYWRRSTKRSTKALISAPITDRNLPGPVLFNDLFQLLTEYVSQRQVLKLPIWHFALLEHLLAETK
jgi:hypothetical protein